MKMINVGEASLAFYLDDGSIIRSNVYGHITSNHAIFNLEALLQHLATVMNDSKEKYFFIQSLENMRYLVRKDSIKKVEVVAKDKFIEYRKEEKNEITSWTVFGIS